jgi:hypothetical protein
MTGGFPETEINGEKNVSFAVKIGENRENLFKNRVLILKNNIHTKKANVRVDLMILWYKKTHRCASWAKKHSNTQE